MFSKSSNCAALNPSIEGDSYIGRVVGKNDGGTITNNIAFDGMSIITGGVDVSTAELKAGALWASTLNWDMTDVWEITKTGNLPTLRGLPGQNGEIFTDLETVVIDEGSKVWSHGGNLYVKAISPYTLCILWYRRKTTHYTDEAYW